MCAINVCVHMCIHSRKEGGREQRRLFHEVIWSTPAFGQVGQSEFFGSFLVITCRNAYLRQKRWAGGLGWPAGGEPRIDLGRSILVPGTPRPRYSHVSLTISFHQIPLPSNESLFCLSNWVKYVLLAAKTSSPSVKQELGQVTRSTFQMLPNPPGLPFSPRFSLPTLKVAGSKLHELPERELSEDSTAGRRGTEEASLQP